MPWTAPPEFNLLPVTPFVDALKLVMERDYAAALAYYNGLYLNGVTLRGLQAIRTARQVAEQWPVMNILPAGSDPVMNEGASLLHEGQRILCEWETVSRVPDALARHLPIYATAGRSVVYEMGKTDLTAGIPQGARTGISWSVSSGRPGERFYEAENLWTMVESFVLTINYTEGRSNG